MVTCSGSGAGGGRIDAAAAARVTVAPGGGGGGGGAEVAARVTTMNLTYGSAFQTRFLCTFTLTILVCQVVNVSQLSSHTMNSRRNSQEEEIARRQIGSVSMPGIVWDSANRLHGDAVLYTRLTKQSIERYTPFPRSRTVVAYQKTETLGAANGAAVNFEMGGDGPVLAWLRAVGRCRSAVMGVG